MKRGSPLRRTPLSRARLRAKPRDPEREAAYADARATVLARAGGWCEGCSVKITLATMHCHHRRPRSAGRDDSPPNLVAYCSRCHADAHAGPARSIRNGTIISRHDCREPAQVPILLPSGWALLTTAGDFVHLPGWTPGP